MKASAITVIGVCVLFFLAYAPTVHAYIDPGSQTLLLQGLLAVLGGLLAFMRRPRDLARSLLDSWRRRRSKGA